MTGGLTGWVTVTGRGGHARVGDVCYRYTLVQSGDVQHEPSFPLPPL